MMAHKKQAYTKSINIYKTRFLLYEGKTQQESEKNDNETGTQMKKNGAAY